MTFHNVKMLATKYYEQGHVMELVQPLLPWLKLFHTLHISAPIQGSREYPLLAAVNSIRITYSVLACT